MYRRERTINLTRFVIMDGSDTKVLIVAKTCAVTSTRQRHIGQEKEHIQKHESNFFCFTVKYIYLLRKVARMSPRKYSSVRHESERLHVVRKLTMAF